MNRPTHLRVEHLDEPFGITTRRPRLSWRLPAGARCQHHYQLQLGDWTSGQVRTPAHVLVRPPGAPALRSRERVDWRVRIRTDLGRSGWSEPAYWEAGLLDGDDWSARWIEPHENAVVGPDRPAHVLRHRFTVASAVVRARVYATALGLYELFVNGVRAGDAELTPGFTSYHTTVQVQTYDVTALLRPGRNTVGVLLSDGWYRGRLGLFQLQDCFGPRTAALVQLEMDLRDGGRVVVGSGADWRSTPSEIVAADLVSGQAVDLRLRRPWFAADADPGAPEGWHPVTVADHGYGRLVGPVAPPVRRVAQIEPVSVRAVRAGYRTVDLGQNINGWVRLSRLDPAGGTVRLVHGESLDDDGTVTRDHLLPESVTRRGLTPGQVDTVTGATGAAEVFEPRHTTHGFRYVGIEGACPPLSTGDVTGVVVHTDLRRTGWFRCADDRLDRLHDAASWSLRGNACDIPTDCPTRERAGWTGDWAAFVPAAALLYDVAGFSAKWLRDLAAEQAADGRVGNIVPGPYLAADPFFRRVDGSAGWGDAAVIVPWEIHRAYGDVEILARQWPSMTAWVDHAARRAALHRHRDRAVARPEPLEHERFLWDTGFHWGEWLEPGATNDVAGAAAADPAPVATAYLHRCATLVARTATVLGRDAERRRYERVAAGALRAWRAEFVDPDGRVRPDTQATHVRALAFGLVPQRLRDATARRLVELVRAAGDHLGTGFLATPWLLPVLADAGHVDVAYDLLLQTTSPSWLTMIDRGATTVWENWDGIDAQGRAHDSLNHYSKGAVVSFLYTHVAGIRIRDEDPGYRRFVIAPCLPADATVLPWAEAVHLSPYGPIGSAWRRDGPRVRLVVDVPPGTCAQVRLPDGQAHDTGPGRHTFHWRHPR